MSVIEVLHDVAISTIKKGKKVKSDEYVIKGEKGLTIKYFLQDDKNKEKIIIKGKDGVYKMKTNINGEITEKDLDEKGLEKELKSTKLKFAKEQLKGGAKVNSDLVGGRKGSKKAGSKKAGSKKAGSKKAGSKKSSSKK